MKCERTVRDVRWLNFHGQQMNPPHALTIQTSDSSFLFTVTVSHFPLAMGQANSTTSNYSRRLIILCIIWPGRMNNFLISHRHRMKNESHQPFRMRAKCSQESVSIRFLFSSMSVCTRASAILCGKHESVDFDCYYDYVLDVGCWQIDTIELDARMLCLAPLRRTCSGRTIESTTTAMMMLMLTKMPNK